MSLLMNETWFDPGRSGKNSVTQWVGYSTIMNCFFEHTLAPVFVNNQKYSAGKHELWFRIPQETSCYFK